MSPDEAGVDGSAFTRTVDLERVAAMAAGCILLFLCVFQIGLATGAVSGRMARGGRFDTLPPLPSKGERGGALLVVVMAWILLERAAVVDVVGGDAAIGVAAWAVTSFFLLSTVGNLASSSTGQPGLQGRTSCSHPGHRRTAQLRTQVHRRPFQTLYAFDLRRIAVLLIAGDKIGDDRWYDVFVSKADGL